VVRLRVSPGTAAPLGLVTVTVTVVFAVPPFAKTLPDDTATVLVVLWVIVALPVLCPSASVAVMVQVPPVVVAV